MFFFFDDEHPYTSPATDSLGVFKVENIKDYVSAKEQLKKLKDLYDKMGQEKPEVDEEAAALEEAIWEQEKQIDDFSSNISIFDTKYLSSNLEFLLKKEHMKVSDLETLLNVSAGYISRTIGVDSKKRLSIDIVWAIARLFSVNIDDLLNRDLTAPTKDLKMAVDFVEKLENQTNDETLHWKTYGDKPTEDTGIFFETLDEKTVFAPNKKIEDFYVVKGINFVSTRIVDIFFVELQNVFDELSFRFYTCERKQRQDGTYKVFSVNMLFTSSKDITGLLDFKCNKLKKTIKSHEADFVISYDTKRLLNAFLKQNE